MKTTIVIVLGLIGTQAFAQKMNSKDVPANVKAGLEKNFTIKDAKWDKEDSNYEANFKKDGKEMSAVFDGSGALIETEVEIAKSELPQAIQNALKKDYPDYKLEETAKITAKGVVTYEVEVEKGESAFELIFDNTGKVLKKEVEKEGNEKD